MEHVENTEQLYVSSLQCLIYKLSITRQSLHAGTLVAGKLAAGID